MVIQRGEVWWASLPDPGGVLLTRESSGLPRDSVVNVTQLVTLDRSRLSDRVRRVPASLMRAVDGGVRLVLDL